MRRTGLVGALVAGLALGASCSRTRVETFGSPDVHWVRASVDTRDAEVFSFQPEIVEENVTP